MEKLYLYTTKPEKRNQIRNLAKSLGMQLSEIGPGQLAEPVGKIVGITGKWPRDPGVPLFYNMPEVLLIFGLTDGRLDAFLYAYREAGIEAIPLKAVVTPYNCGMSLYQLIGELQNERKRFVP